ncbi:MAG: GlcG/HbpS family heme-binding protein [Phototrophicaceae bacterium]
MHEKTVLSHSDAAFLIDTIRTRLEAEALGAAAAVVDEHGELLAFIRTDGCRLPSIQIAINKAYTAAREQIPSGELGRRSREGGFPMTNFGELRYVTWGGGLPIVINGVTVGALGVSGLPEAKDIEIAQSALHALEQKQEGQ